MSSAAPHFPAPRGDDDGDVHWALTTAGALWAKGDGAEALKWLRRAAESASDANQDARSLELFKAAADVTSRLQSRAPEAPPPTMGPSSMPPRTELAPPVMAPQGPPQAHKSAPPPPPRRGGGQGPRSMVEPMANTVPGPRVSQVDLGASPRPPGPPPMPPPHPHPHAGPPPMPHVAQHSVGQHSVGQQSVGQQQTRAPQTPKMPITPSAPTRISGRAPVSTTAGKTLASNLTYEQAKDTAAEIRRAVAKTVQPDGRARPMPTAARLSSDRATHPGMGPPVTSPADAPPPSSRGKRRTTQTGRKHAGAVAAARAQIGEINRQSSPEAHRTPTVVFTAVQAPTDVAIHDAPSEVSRTQRFEDEGTVAEKEEKEATLIGVSFPDLDEQTNVLTGKQTNAVLDVDAPLRVDSRPTDENGSIDVSLDGSIDSATDPGANLDGDLGSNADTRQTALPRGLLTAFRVAVSEVGGRLEIVPLVPGEPTPAGAVGCMVVATDVQSSVGLADLLGKRVRRGQKP